MTIGYSGNSTTREALLGPAGLDGLLLMVVLGDSELGARWTLGCGAQIR